MQQKETKVVKKKKKMFWVVNQISLLIPDVLLEFKLCLFECWAIPFILWALLSSWIKPMSQLWVTPLVNNTADQLQTSQSIPHTSRVLMYWQCHCTVMTSKPSSGLTSQNNEEALLRKRFHDFISALAPQFLKTRPVSNSRIISLTLRQGLNEGSKPWETGKKDPDPSPRSSA